MKKLLSSVLVLLLCLGMTPPAAAEMAVVGKRTTISAGSATGAVKEDGSLWMWGPATMLGNGAVGNDNYGYSGDHPIQTVPLKVWDSVVSFNCNGRVASAIRADGSLWMWGDVPLIGAERPAVVTAPMKVMDDVAAVYSDNNVAVIKTDGSLWTWGYENSSGDLGNGTTEHTMTPVKILDNVVAFSSAMGSSAAIKSDGSLWMWGRNDYNQLLNGGVGNGSLNLGPRGTVWFQTVPVKVMDDVACVSCSGTTTAVVKTDGTLWMWGSNFSAALGDGTYTDRLTPEKVMDNVSYVTSCGGAVAAIKTDGTLWMWGSDEFGQQPYTTRSVTTPTKVMDDVAAVSLNLHVAALKTDGTLWMWGYNLEGEAGVGSWGDNNTVQDPTLVLTDVAVPVSAVTPTAPAVAGFSDVHEDDYYAEAVAWAKDAGVTGGTSATTFSPDNTVTRAEAVTFLWRAAGAPQPASSASPFSDVADPGAYYYSAVLWAAEQGITGGVGDNRFDLNGTLTYDQILAMLCRAAGEDAAGSGWSDAAVSWAAENGLTDGLDFTANGNCPRSDVVYCLWKQLAE